MLDMSESFEDQPLGYLLGRVMFALKADVTATVLDRLGVAFPEYLCMRVLSKYPGQSNADLARALNVSPQAMNMVLRRKDSGLVCRFRMDVKDPRFLVVDPDDGVRHDLILFAKPIVELRDGRRYRVGVLGDAATSSLCACFRQ